MTRPIHLAIAAAALVLAGGFSVAHAGQIFDSSGPSRYAQMNSPGDGISSGARRTGNGRVTRKSRRVKRYR